MVLHKSKIRERLEKATTDPDSLTVTPLVSGRDALDEDSIDLRLGTHFLLGNSDRLAVHVPGFADEQKYTKRHVPIGRYLVLPGHHTVLAATLEFIRLPADLSAMVLTKSSWARTFVTVESAPWVHPFYRGCLTLEIANASEIPVTLYPGTPIAQLVLFEVQGVTDTADKLQGSYLGPTKPQPARLRRPAAQLERDFGVPPSGIAYPRYWPGPDEDPGGS